MKEKLQTKFATRQYMISDTFELYYYSTVDVPGVKEHTHTCLLYTSPSPRD